MLSEIIPSFSLIGLFLLKKATTNSKKDHFRFKNTEYVNCAAFMQITLLESLLPSTLILYIGI